MFKKAKENKKGFTLAELLIVVAIIAVLVAISIPIFTSQLEKSREATDLANIRSAYAQVQSAALLDSKKTADGVTYTEADHSYSMTVTAVQAQENWQNGATEVAGITLPEDIHGKTVTIKCTIGTNDEATTTIAVN